MSARHFRMIGDAAAELTDDEVDRLVATGQIAVREAARAPAIGRIEFGDGVPEFVELLAAGGAVQRAPLLDTWGEGWLGASVRVWRFANAQLPIAGATDSQHHIAINVGVDGAARCPVRQIAVLGHELRHIERRDGRSLRGRELTESELDCEAAAARAVTGAIDMIDRHAPPMTRTDAAVCQRCHVERAATCAQTDRARERVRVRLGSLMPT